MIFLFFHIGVLMVCDRMIQQIGQEQFVSVFMCKFLETVYQDQKKRKYEWSQSFTEANKVSKYKYFLTISN